MSALACSVAALAAAGGGTLVAALASAVVIAFATRIALWWSYSPRCRPIDASTDTTALPELTVVIPAFNEGPMVRRSIESVLASDYPADKLHLIVVNDGSSDDTAAHIDAAVREHGARVDAIHLPHNRGKRHALYAGFKRARGQVVATLDSDSEVEPGALANLVAPLVADADAGEPRVGGVGGKVVALNRSSNWLTRMLGVRYILGFDFVRAYQSQLRTVWCLPGALQAYRLDLIRPHLESWRDQTFLGAQCTNGDDHAMTNLVLSLGADTAYQSNAVVHTEVPETYRRLSKMYVRWGRSATREGLRALRFAPARALRLGHWRGALMLLDAVLQPLTLLARVVGLGAALAVTLTSPVAVLAGLAWTAAFALIYTLIFLRSERSTEALFGVLYAFFAMVALPWVQPFATLTVRRNGWMTRG